MDPAGRLRLPPLWAVALLLAAGCGDAAGPLASHTGVDRIVFVTIDTLRADHLDSYGYPRVTSPFIGRLATGGILFENAFTSMATTVPSHASIFTSLYPIQHGLRRNGQVLTDEVVTLAEEMQRWGLRTAAFVSTRPHFVPGNLDQGFEVFWQPRGGKGREGRSRRVVSAAIDWLSGIDPGERFFLWVHLFDPHTPLDPPADLLERFASEPPELREAHARFLAGEQHIDADYHRGEGRDLLELIDAYDAEIGSSDRELARLWQALGRRGLDARTLWVVTSDHGEGLGNHRWMGHGAQVYNEQLRVPLILHFTSGRHAGRRVRAVVETVDLLPTLAALLDQPLSDSPLPRQGTSLLGLLSEGREPDGAPARLAFAERRSFAEGPDRSVRAEDQRLEPGEKFAVQDAAFKLVHRTEGPDELYDLRADPYETRNLIEERPAEAERLAGHLVERLGALRPSEPAEAELADDETIRMLEELGYVQ